MCPLYSLGWRRPPTSGCGNSVSASCFLSKSFPFSPLTQSSLSWVVFGFVERPDFNAKRYLRITQEHLYEHVATSFKAKQSQ